MTERLTYRTPLIAYKRAIELCLIDSYALRYKGALKDTRNAFEYVIGNITNSLIKRVTERMTETCSALSLILSSFRERSTTKIEDLTNFEYKLVEFYVCGVKPHFTNFKFFFYRRAAI